MNKRYMIMGLLILTMSAIQAGDKNKSNATRTSYFSKTIRTCAIIASALGSQFVLVSTPQAQDVNLVPMIITVGENTAPTINDVFYYSEEKTLDNTQPKDFESMFEL